MRATSLFLWFGLFGPAGAWTAQHVAGIQLSTAACPDQPDAMPRFNLDAWTIVVTATLFAVAVAATASAIVSFRRTSDAGTEAPGARMRFLAIIAVTTAPLFLFMILMSGLGVVFLTECRQS